MQLTFDTISPYNICADRLGITKTCKPWIATMANWKGKACHVPETPKDISYYIHSKMAELNSSGNFIVESTREYLPDQKKSVLVSRQRYNVVRYISYVPHIQLKGIKYEKIHRDTY